MATHFLTADGNVLHSVAGPVSPQTLIEEAQWALDLYQQASHRPASQRRRTVAQLHEQASWSPASNRDRQIHELFARYPLPKLTSVYQQIFTGILGEKVSDAGPRLAEASRRLAFAKQSGRPILYVLHRGHQWNRGSVSPSLRPLIDQYVIIAMPLREAPALSQLTGQPPFEGSSNANPLLVVAMPDGRQIGSATHWSHSNFGALLAHVWIDVLEQNPPSIRVLLRAQRLLRDIDQAAANRAKALAIEVQESAEAARDAELKQRRLQRAAHSTVGAAASPS